MPDIFLLPPTFNVNTAVSVLAQGFDALAAGSREIDFASVTAVDSSAIAVLLAWQRRAKREGFTLMYRHFPPDLKSLAQLYGVTELLVPPPAA